MPETKNHNRKESAQPFNPNEEVVLYSYAEQKPGKLFSTLSNMLDFFSPKKTDRHEIATQQPELPHIPIDFDQPIEIAKTANTIVTPAFEEIAAKHPQITQAAKIITSDFSAIHDTLELAKAHLPHSELTVIRAIKEQFNREGIKDVEISLATNDSSNLTVGLKFMDEKTPHKVFITDPELLK